MSKNVLVIAPHGDDEVLGVGGTIQRHIKSGDVVTVCFIKGFENKRQRIQLQNTRKVQSILNYEHIVHLNRVCNIDHSTTGLVTQIDSIITKYTPEIIYCPGYGDMHQDHRIISHACGSSVRLGNNFKVNKVLLYEIPSSTDQGFAKFESPFIPNYYVSLNKQQIKQKCNCMNMYTLEQGSLRSNDAIIDLAKKRGRECSREYAEAFVCMRYIHD